MRINDHQYLSHESLQELCGTEVGEKLSFCPAELFEIFPLYIGAKLQGSSVPKAVAAHRAAPAAVLPTAVVWSAANCGGGSGGAVVQLYPSLISALPKL